MHPLSIAVRAGIFSASLIAAGGVIAGTVNIPGVDALARELAYMAGFALGMLGVPASLDGAVINADGFVAVVAAECTAIELILVFGAAVIVWPVSLRARIWALLMGVPALCVLNLVRVITLLLIGVDFPEYFEMAHLKVGQMAMAVATLAMWLLWLRWASGSERTSELAARQ